MDKNIHKYCFASPISDWHLWFAWHPVKTWYGKWVWLRKVERRMLATHSYLSGPHFQWFEYHID